MAQPPKDGREENLNGPTKRTIKWVPISKVSDLMYPRLVAFKVPQYLHDKIDSEKKSTSRLAWFHNALSNKHDTEKQLTPRLAWFHNALSNKHDIEMLLERCVWSSTASGSTCPCSRDVSIAENLDSFQQELLDGANRDLTFCAINTSTDLGLSVPWYVSLQTPPVAHFRNLLKIVFESRWPGFQENLSGFMTRHQTRQPPQLTLDLQLPSKRTSALHTARSLKGLDISLEWLSKPSGVETLFWSFDWSIYVSEPYSRRPTQDVLQIVDVTVKNSDKHRMVLTATSGEALIGLKRAHNQAVKDGAIDPKSAVEEQLTGAVMAYLGAVVSNVTQYIKGSIELVQSLDMASRKRPSVSKVQFLLHIRECDDWALQACCQNMETIRQRFHLDCKEGEACRFDAVQAHVDDIKYLSERIKKHREEIGALIEVISNQVDLFDKRRSKTIGFFIAVYVPLAFATSFFGMNIEHVSSRAAWTNTTSSEYNSTANDTYPWYLHHERWGGDGSRYYPMEDGVQPDLNDPLYRNITPDTAVARSATLTTTSEPENYLWPMWMFWTVAGTLTFGSIILPIVIPPSYRWLARISLQWRRSFRAFVSILWIFFLVISIDAVSDRMFGPIEVGPLQYGPDGTEYSYPPLMNTVTGLGIILGLEALRRNVMNRQPGQIVMWSVWLAICAVDLFLLTVPTSYNAAVIGEYVLAALMRLVWFWVLLNWTFAPKGSSWSIYPATPDESMEDEVELDLANLVNN